MMEGKILMSLRECKKRLHNKAKASQKAGYDGDAVDVMFKYYVLELVERVAMAVEKPHKPKKKPSAYNVFFGKKAKEGLPPTKIAKLWKEKKKVGGI